MAVRVTDQEVTALIAVPDGKSVMPFIETATLIVDEQLVSKGLSDARLKQIELYLAAHFVTLMEEKGSLVREDVGEARQSMWGVSLGTGLTMTRFGQQAIALDTSGTLSNMATISKSAQFRTV